MILLLGDVHCQYDLVNIQLDHAERHVGRPVEAVVLLGDLGLFEPFLSRFFRKRGERFRRPTYFVEGNHEDFSCFDTLVRKYADVITHLPRATVHTIGRWRALAFGGAAYMDAHATPPGAVIRPEDIAASLQHASDCIDIVLSHDCPSDLGVPATPGLEYYGSPGFPDGERIRRHFCPRLWAFGHHHRWFDKMLDSTRFYGLAESWHGYGLLFEPASLEIVLHHVPPPAGFWTRLERRLRSAMARRESG